MLVLAVLGSPRDLGRSNTVIRSFLAGARAAGHEVIEYNVNKMNIKGCQACGACKSTGTDCVLDDDLTGYWEHLHGAGALIVGAPNYCGLVSGPMITYLNRHYCLLDKNWEPTIPPGIKLFGVFSQANGDADAYMPAYRHFMADFENRKMELADLIVCAGGDGVTPTADELNRAWRDGNSL